MSQKRSAKDMAFERERAKYRKQIRELQSELRAKEARIADLKEEFEHKRNRDYREGGLDPPPSGVHGAVTGRT